MKTKFIFVTGGVVSSLGKGITASAIGQILKSRGLKVFMQKLDPYLNVDPSSMSPLQHGEVFVTDDGAETDLDLGHYERFIDENLNKYSSISAGKIYQNVLNNERDGLYEGKTVQVIPHVTNEIKQQLKNVAKLSKADVVIVEVGGTVGDIESLPFLEAIRQARRDFGYKNTLYIHATLVPYIKAAKEIKTKPTQHSVSELKSLGIQPDMIVLRTEKALTKATKQKISLFCDVKDEAVFEVVDVNIIYQTILNLKAQKIDDFILKHFKYDNLTEADLTKWEHLIKSIITTTDEVKIGLVGKYTSLHDAYLSVVESLRHAGFYHHHHVKIEWIDSSKLDETNIDKKLNRLDGIIVPGGFGKRGTNGILDTLKYGRENLIPTFGICYGMELAAIEYARNVIGLKGANTPEIDPQTKYKIFKLNEPNGNDKLLRVGLSKFSLKPKTKAYEIYHSLEISERHRHRYSFNLKYYDKFEKAGMVFSGYDHANNMVEIIELRDHPWYLGTQFHPEYASRPLRAHPLFISFLEAAINYKNGKNK